MRAGGEILLPAAPRRRGKLVAAPSVAFGLLVVEGAAYASRHELRGIAARWIHGGTWFYPRRAAAKPWTAFAALLISVSALRAQDSRRLCKDEEQPGCPGSNCPCTDDTLAITFDENGGSFLEYGPVEGAPIETTIVIETSRPGAQGWSYGVRHDPATLTLEEVTTTSTSADELAAGGFNATSMDKVVFCGDDPRCQNPIPGGGYISAFVLSLKRPISFPAGRNTVCRATYRPVGKLAHDLTTRIEFSEELAFRGSPRVAINITVNGSSTQPRTVFDGLVTGVGPPFRRGDPDGDGRVSVSDAVFALFFLYLSGPAPACLEGADTNDDGRLDPADAIAVLSWLFLRGPSLASPGTGPCGMDPEGSFSYLGCGAYEKC